MASRTCKDTIVSGNTVGPVAGQQLARVSGPQTITSRRQTGPARLALSPAHEAAIALRDASQTPGTARTTLSQADFNSGTYRIKAAGTYVLGENVAFYPNPPTGMPTAAQRAPGGEYEGHQYGLGFFAAITVEAPNVVIDLAGHTLSQHPQHRLRQRFFALIELAASPFLMGQGPADFGSPGAPCTNIVVHSGTLLGSSHHGVHGNGAAGVLIEDLAITDYEVAAISINGSRDFLVRRVETRTSSNVPATSQYSHAVHARPFLAAIVERDPAATVALRGVDTTVTSILAALDADIALVLAGTPPAYMRAVDGLSDCNAYGILFAGTGVHVGPALPTPDPANTRNYVQNVVVDGVRSRPREIPAIPVELADHSSAAGGYGSKGQAGPQGDVFDAVMAAGPSGHYVGNALADAQLAIAVLGVGAAERGHTSISERVIGWGASGTTTLRTASGEKYEFIMGLDSMGHTMKGNFGVIMLRACSSAVVSSTVRGVEVVAVPVAVLPA